MKGLFFSAVVLGGGVSLAAVFAPIEGYFGVTLPYVPPPSSLDLRVEGDALNSLMRATVSNRLEEARQDPRLAALTEYFQQGNLPLAAMALENIRRTSPPGTWAQLPLGDVYFEMGWYAQAAEFCGQALTVKPDLEGVRRVQVASLILAKQPAAAVAAARGYAEQRRDDPLAHILLARAELSEGRTNEAFHAVAQALLLDERRLDAWQLKAQLLLDARKPKEALEAALKCRQLLGAENPEIALLLGRSFAALNERAQAEKFLREAAGGSQQPRLEASLTLARFLENTDRKAAIKMLEAVREKYAGTAAVHSDLARLYAADLRLADAAHERGAAAFLDGRTDDALEAVLDAVAADPDRVDNHVKASALLQQRGELKAAVKMAQQALVEFPDNADVTARLAVALAADGRLDDAAKLLDGALDSVRESEQVRIERARLYAAGKDYAKALQLLEPLLAASPGAGTCLLAGKWRLETGDTRGARDAYARGLRMSPADAQMINGFVYSTMLGGAPAADLLPMARKAVELAPGDAAVADTLGWVLAESGGHTEALHILEGVVAKMPDNPSAQYHHALALARSGKPALAEPKLRVLVNSGKKFPELKSAQELLTTIATPPP